MTAILNASLANGSPGTSGSLSKWIYNGSDIQRDRGSTISSLPKISVSENQHVFLEGEKQTHAYLVESGVMGLYKLLPDGRRQICSFAYPGDIVGLDYIDRHAYSGEALSDTTVRCIPVRTIEQLMQDDPKFGHACLLTTANELADTREQLLLLGRKTPAEKLASFLIRVFNHRKIQAGSDDCVDIPMKRSEIADYLGLTVETVSRTFTRLKHMGIIRLENHGRVRILEADRLTAIADGLTSINCH